MIKITSIGSLNKEYSLLDGTETQAICSRNSCPRGVLLLPCSLLFVEWFGVELPGQEIIALFKFGPFPEDVFIVLDIETTGIVDDDEIEENGALVGVIWYCPGMLGGAEAVGCGRWCFGEAAVEVHVLKVCWCELDICICGGPGQIVMRGLEFEEKDIVDPEGTWMAVLVSVSLAANVWLLAVETTFVLLHEVIIADV